MRPNQVVTSKRLRSVVSDLLTIPIWARSCDYVRRGLRRLEHGKHVVFYRRESGGILVSRFLHQNMLATRHAMDDPDDAG